MIDSMQREGLLVDLPHFERLGVQLRMDMEELTESVKVMTGKYVLLSSGDQVADLLFRHLKLVQARPRMTASGDRESVENDVLEQIKHAHPVVPLILQFKEVAKLENTYVRPMAALIGPDGRIRPNFRVTRVSTGRLACNSPNLMAIPVRSKRGKDVRRGFIAPPGWVYVSLDLCFHPDTSIETLTGHKRIADIVEGDKVLTKRGDRIEYGAVTKSKPVMSQSACRLTFDNGESVIASLQHKWPVQVPRGVTTGEEIVKTTDELVVGDSMVPCKRGDVCGYDTWYSSRGATVYTSVHRTVAEAYMGPRPPGYHTHHKDGDRRNNAPENLEYKPKFNHASDHSKENYRIQDHTLRLSKLKSALKSRRTYNGTGNPHAKLVPADYEAIRSMYDSGIRAKAIATHFGISYGHTRQIIKGTKGGPINHKLVSKEYLGIQPMHAITVEPDHNYVLSCGVVTYNSQIEMRVSAHHSGCKELIRVYEDDLDVYSDFAMEAFHLPNLAAVDRDLHRTPAKTCVLGVMYDVSAKGLLEQMPVGMGWDEPKCAKLIAAFYAKYPEIMIARMGDHGRARQFGFVWCMFGRIRHIPEIRSKLRWVMQSGMRQAGNQPIQAGAQGVIKLMMAECQDIIVNWKLERDVKPKLQVHDELIFECRQDIAEEWLETVGVVAEHCCPLRVPIKWGGSMALTWGDLSK